MLKLNREALAGPMLAGLSYAPQQEEAMSVSYVEVIIRKAEQLKARLRHCSSSDVMHQAYVDIEDIIHAAKMLKEKA